MTRQEAARILDIKQREAVIEELYAQYGNKAICHFVKLADEACQMAIGALIGTDKGQWRPLLERYPAFQQVGKVLSLGFYCSQCDNQISKKTKYCPHCGARMED